MSENEQYELVGRTRANYKERKKELAALKVKASNLAESAQTLFHGLQNPELIRWWTGAPMIGQRGEHVVFTDMMFSELSQPNIKKLAEDIHRLKTTVDAIRKQLIDLEGEDPEHRVS